MDRLSGVFKHFAPSARVFYSGSECRQATFNGEQGSGHIHILKSGRLLLNHGAGELLEINRPSVIFLPRSHCHNFQACGDDELELVCASIDLNSRVSNPFYDALPNMIVLPYADVQGLEAALAVLFYEAFGDHCGRQVALDSLASYFLVLLLRHLIETNNFSVGVLAGMNDNKLIKALLAIHERPEHTWSLERLAETCGMSRARFSSHFKTVVGTTPMDYLNSWRMGVVQARLKQGYAIKQIAPMVGYQSTAAMSRAFKSCFSVSPSEWLSHFEEDSPRPAL